MSNLIIPKEFKKNINPFSGFLDSNYIYSNKDLKGLFFTNENQNYLIDELYSLLTSKKYIEQSLPKASINSYSNETDKIDRMITGFNNKSIYFNKVDLLYTLFKTRKNEISKYIFSLVEAFQLPFREDENSLNPIIQLHNTNLKFLTETSRTIIQQPQNLISDVDRVNPDTGKVEYGQSDYDASSYSTGVWKPEDLFMNTYRNRTNPYWTPLEINIYSDPDASGSIPGHKYNNIIYNEGTKAYYDSNIAKDGSWKVPKINDDNSYGQFPGWQYTVNNRPYDKDQTQGLRDGGKNDRRVQIAGGFNMNSLRKKSTY